MPGERVPATRTNLLEARRSLSFAREGYELLDRKRQVLIAEATRLIEDARAVRHQIDSGFAKAYRALAVARMMVHVDRVEWAALAAGRGAELRTVERSVMGVAIPTVELAQSESGIPYAPIETGASLDQAVRAFEELLSVIAQAAETETAAWRLAREIRKTQRRVNALSTIFIPKYETRIAKIEAALEEKEREAFFRSKMVKRKREEKGRAVTTLFDRILIPVDGSQPSMQAARLAIDIARQHGSALAGLFVVDTHVLDALSRLAERGKSELKAELEATGQRCLNEVARLARGAGLTAEQFLRDGDPYDQILAEASRWQATLIVMGRVGRHGARRILLGSTTERVLEHGQTPVLVVPAQHAS